MSDALGNVLRLLAAHRDRRRRQLGIILIACAAVTAILLIVVPLAAILPAATIPMGAIVRRRRLAEIDRFTDVVRTRADEVVWAYGADMGLRVNGLPTNRLTHVVIRLRSRETYLLWHAGNGTDELLEAMRRAMPQATFGFTRERAQRFSRLGVVS